MLGTSMAQAAVNLGLGSFGVDTVAAVQVIGEYISQLQEIHFVHLIRSKGLGSLYKTESENRTTQTHIFRYPNACLSLLK